MGGLQNRIAQKINEIKKSAHEYPGAVVIHNWQKMKIEYVSEFGLRSLKQDWEEIRHLSIEEYHERYFNPEDAKAYTPKIQAMLMGDPDHEVISLFQQVRTGENREWEWYLTSIRVLMHDDEGKPLLTISFAIQVEAENHITHKVNRLLEENTFLREHYPLFSSLGKREKQVLQLLAMGKSSQEVASELFISEMTVRTHRKNINKKLNIKSPFDLQQFARAFDLI